jgi:hypothetical protein
METSTLLKGQYGLRRGGSLKEGFRFRGRVLAPHIPIGSISDSPVAGVLGNKLVILGGSAIAYVYLHCLHIHFGLS